MSDPNRSHTTPSHATRWPTRIVLKLQVAHVSNEADTRSLFGNAVCPLRHFLRHFFDSFVSRRAPSCADDPRRKTLFQSRLSGTEGLFAEQDGTSPEMTLDYLVMVRIHARQVAEPEHVTNVLTLALKTVMCHF
jgi:hypothetical protein